MATEVHGIAGLKELVGQHLGYSDYLEITQERVNTFATPPASAPAANPFAPSAPAATPAMPAAPGSNTIDNIPYAFAYWSDGGDRSHTFVAPADTYVLTLHSLIGTLTASAQPAAPALRIRCDLPHQPQVTCPTG